MNNKKGMSQILVLIVAAAVLMMVGLLLISLSSGSITDVFTGSQSAACTSQLDSQCTTSGLEEIPQEDYPPTCTTDGGLIEGVEDEYDCG